LATETILSKRLRRATSVCVLAFASLGGLTAACGGAAAGSSPAETARSYVNAYNRHDGKAICAAAAGELRNWFEHMPGFKPGLGCAKVAAAMIGYGEESDTPTFQRLKVLSVRPHVTGETARVEVKARYHYKAYPNPLNAIVTDEIYLAAPRGDWTVLKPGGVYFATRSAYSPPANALDPPIMNAEAHRAAPQLPARFVCAPKPALVGIDPPNDTPAPLDLRRITAAVNADASVCLTLSFAEPPYPGTEIALRIERPEPGSSSFRVYEGSVRIGSGGHFAFSMARARPRQASRLLRAGWRNGRLEILVRMEKGKRDPRHPLRVSVNTRPLQWWEPLVRHPLSGNSDEPESGDSFSLYPR
jgi:hypothetical protein